MGEEYRSQESGVRSQREDGFLFCDVWTLRNS